MRALITFDVDATSLHAMQLALAGHVRQAIGAFAVSAVNMPCEFRSKVRRG